MMAANLGYYSSGLKHPSIAMCTDLCLSVFGIHSNNLLALLPSHLSALANSINCLQTANWGAAHHQVLCWAQWMDMGFAFWKLKCYTAVWSAADQQELYTRAVALFSKLSCIFILLLK